MVRMVNGLVTRKVKDRRDNEGGSVKQKNSNQLNVECNAKDFSTLKMFKNVKHLVKYEQRHEKYYLLTYLFFCW